ncbi:SGNH/GDSL hydrolase family protein [Thermodesulfobacteriota bacterium]
MKKIQVNLILLLCSFFLALITCEFGYRTLVFLIKGTFKPQITFNRKLGWVTTPHLKEKSRSSVDFGGQKYVKKYETFRHGFRAWGDVSRTKTKIFFLGDSFTLAADVSNENTYYSVFKIHMPEDIEVFAYGGGGYGNLQEYFIIDLFIDEIQPNILVLQFCSNDFGNNSYEYEKNSIVLNQTIRPYLNNDGKIIYRYSEWHPYPFLLKYSRLFALIDRQIQKLRFMINKGYSTNKPTHSSLNKDVQITTRIMQKIKQRIPKDVQLYTFNCSGPNEDKKIYNLFIKVASENGFAVIPNIAQAVADAEAKGAVVRAKDGAHLSNLGNEIMGKKLADFFVSVLAKTESYKR